MVRFNEREQHRFRELQQHDEKYSQNGQILIAGIDEAGRGCLAGPVAAAAVILAPGFYLPGVDDSKVISEKKRHRLAEGIKKEALAWAVALVSHSYIDASNILAASREAMRQALLSLPVVPGLALIDAVQLDDIKSKQVSLIKGDASSLCIACASILAKTERDLIMRRYAQIWPAYGFEQHKGYGTRQHLDSLRTAGCCGIHRMTFEPIKTWYNGGGTGEFGADNI